MTYQLYMVPYPGKFQIILSAPLFLQKGVQMRSYFNVQISSLERNNYLYDPNHSAKSGLIWKWGCFSCWIFYMAIP